MQERIGRYELLERIASGGQGTVYRARDTVLDRVVAVKVINQNVEDDPAYLEALQREARLAARLSHPNIATVYDFQVEDGIPYIVMEFVPDALDRELRGNERLPWRRAVEIGLQTARALQHAHDQGVVHRDIKPQNILLRETGAAALSDFGIARAFASSTRSQTAGVMGTPAYMAPEQWAGGAVDGRLDQYGLGIVLYEIITGKPPFQGDSMEALYVQHRETLMPPMPSALRVPDEVESVIRKTLEKSPDERFGSASELADALEGALTGGAVQSPRTAVTPPPNREAARAQPEAAAPPSRPPQPPVPPRQPAASGSGIGRSGAIPRWLMLGGVGTITIVVIAIIISVVVTGAGEEGSARMNASVGPTSAQVQSVASTIPPTLKPKPTNTPSALFYYDKGKEYLDAKDWSRAVESFTNVLQSNPLDLRPRLPVEDYWKVYIDRGMSYAELDQNTAAFNDFNKAVELSFGNSSAYYNRGVIYLVLNEYKQSIQDFDQAIALDPVNADAYYKRGVAKLELSQQELETKGMWGGYYRNYLQDSISDFDQAIMLNPNNAEAYMGRGTAHHRDGIPGHSYKRAVSDFTEAIRIGGSDDILALAYYKRHVSKRHLDSDSDDIDEAMACSLDNRYCHSPTIP